MVTRFIVLNYCIRNFQKIQKLNYTNKNLNNPSVTMKTMKNSCFHFLTFAILLGLLACEGQAGPEDPQGPRGEQGPIGPQGDTGQQGTQGVPVADGNANVTLYIFNGNNFSNTNIATRRILLDNEQQLIESGWLFYLRFSQPANNEFPFIHYYVPGRGFAGNSEYRVNHAWQAISLDA